MAGLGPLTAERSSIAGGSIQGRTVLHLARLLQTAPATARERKQGPDHWGSIRSAGFLAPESTLTVGSSLLVRCHFFLGLRDVLSISKWIHEP